MTLRSENLKILQKNLSISVVVYLCWSYINIVVCMAYRINRTCRSGRSAILISNNTTGTGRKWKVQVEYSENWRTYWGWAISALLQSHHTVHSTRSPIVATSRSKRPWKLVRSFRVHIRNRRRPQVFWPEISSLLHLRVQGLGAHTRTSWLGCPGPWGIICANWCFFGT